MSVLHHFSDPTNLASFFFFWPREGSMAYICCLYSVPLKVAWVPVLADKSAFLGGALKLRDLTKKLILALRNIL